MVISGVGAGINELTALAGTARVARFVNLSKRGFYVAVLIFTIVPASARRSCGRSSLRQRTLVGASAPASAHRHHPTAGDFLGLLCLLFFYNPPPRVGLAGLSKMEIIKRTGHSWRISLHRRHRPLRRSACSGWAVSSECLR